MPEAASLDVSGKGVMSVSEREQALLGPLALITLYFANAYKRPPNSDEADALKGD